MWCLWMGSLKTGITRSVLKVECLSGSCFPSAPPYLCQNVSALKSKHRVMKRREGRENSSSFTLGDVFFFPRVLSICLFGFVGAGSDITSLSIHQSCSFVLMSPSPPLPAGETMDRGGCGWGRQVFTYKNTNQTLNSQAEAPSQGRRYLTPKKEHSAQFGHFTWVSCSFDTSSW